jgi:hypothetical protein
MKMKKPTAIPLAILQTMLANGAKRFALNGSFPNEPWDGEHDDQKIGLAIIFPSSQGDFSLNKMANDRLLKAQRDGPLDQGYVVQARKQGGRMEFLAMVEVEELQALLASLNLYEGTYGEYWWVPANFKLDNIIPAGAETW